MDPLAGRRARPFGGGSQLALELGLALYAAVATVVVVRLLLVLFGVDHRSWVGRTFYRFTDPVADALARLPGADRTFVANLTLPDLTLAAIVGLLPIWLLARGARSRPE